MQSLSCDSLTNIWMAFPALGIKTRYLSKASKACPFSPISSHTTIASFPSLKPAETSCVPPYPMVPWSPLVSQLIPLGLHTSIHLLREASVTSSNRFRVLLQTLTVPEMLSSIHQAAVILVHVVCFFHYKFCEGSKPMSFCSPVNPQH